MIAVLDLLGGISLRTGSRRGRKAKDWTRAKLTVVKQLLTLIHVASQSQACQGHCKLDDAWSKPSRALSISGGLEACDLVPHAHSSGSQFAMMV